MSHVWLYLNKFIFRSFRCVGTVFCASGLDLWRRWKRTKGEKSEGTWESSRPPLCDCLCLRGILFSQTLPSLPSRSLPGYPWPWSGCVSVPTEAPPLTHSASFTVAVDTISSICLGYHILLSAGGHPVICNKTKHEQHRLAHRSVSCPLCPSYFILTYWLE